MNMSWAGQSDFVWSALKLKKGSKHKAEGEVGHKVPQSRAECVRMGLSFRVSPWKLILWKVMGIKSVEWSAGSVWDRIDYKSENIVTLKKKKKKG